jgi:tetratricopeptide (TPR) repeat protein
MGRRDAAARAFQTARDLLESEVAEAPRRPEPAAELARVLLHLGTLAEQARDYPAAEREYRRALDLPGPAGDAAAGLRAANGWHLLGNTLFNAGRLPDAEAACRESLARLDRLAPAPPRHRRQRASTLNSLAIVQWKSDRYADARATLQESLTLLRQLAAEFPKQRDYREYLARGYGNLSGLLTTAGQGLEGIAAQGIAIDVLRRLTAEFTSVPKYRQALAINSFNLGLRYRAQEKSAVVRFRGLLAVCLVPPSAGPLTVLPALALPPDEPFELALRAMQTARDLQAELRAESPELAAYRHELARTWANLGNLFNALGRFDEAGDALDRSRGLYDRLVERDSRDAAYRSGLAVALSNQAARFADDRPGAGVDPREPAGAGADRCRAAPQPRARRLPGHVARRVRPPSRDARPQQGPRANGGRGRGVARLTARARTGPSAGGPIPRAVCAAGADGADRERGTVSRDVCGPGRASAARRGGTRPVRPGRPL